jgi:UDP-N-acetylmuramoyl-tripeptide--D-alanyl-D-alanine ligase
MTAEDLVAATGGRLLRHSDRAIRTAAVDSRLVTPGCLFIALSGDRTDGHRFLAQAAAAGAAALLVGREPDPTAGETPLDELGDVTVVLVADPLRALHAVAAEWRRRFALLVIGVTGSIAKTSTKEAVAGVLDGRFRTLRTEGNQNNEVGMPLTVLRLGPEHEAAVLEMGMYTGGEIRDLAQIGLPRIGIVTAIQPVHLSRIGTIEAIVDAKAELLEALPAAADGGVAILNVDDERVRAMAPRTTARVVTYGFAADADVRAEAVEPAGFKGMRFGLVTPEGTRETVSIPALGRLAVHNALAATAAGLAAGMTLDEILPGLVVPSTAPHRSVVIRTGGITIVDDSYNAAPGSMRAALELLAGLPGRHVAVLGEMRELGLVHGAAHHEIGALAASAVNLLVVVDGLPGGAATELTAGADDRGTTDGVLPVADADAALTVLVPRLRPGDVVLVKASRGVALERVVEGLVAALGGPEAEA